jgi:hypothetical protein
MVLVKKNGNAGVIEQSENDVGKTGYIVNDDFHIPLLKVVMGLHSPNGTS